MRTKKRLLYKLMTLMLCLGMLLSTVSLPVTADAIEDTTGGVSNEQPGDTQENVSGEQKGDTSESVSDEQPGDDSENASDKQPGDDSKAARAGSDNADPADASPKSFDVTLDFLGLSPDCLAGADVMYYDGSEKITNDVSVPAENGKASLTLESGRIYIFSAGVANVDNESYIPDMGGVITEDGEVELAEFWIYVSEDGPKLIKKDNYDKLMKDTEFKGLIDRFLETKDCYGLLRMYWSGEEWLQGSISKARMPELLKEHICTLSKDITITNENSTYVFALKFSKRDIKPLKITVVDKKGDPLKDISYQISSLGNDHNNRNGYTEKNGVVPLFNEGETVLPMGLYMVTVRGASKDGSSPAYIRENATDTGKCPADTYALTIYVGPKSIEVVTPDNYDELSDDLQFQNMIRSAFFMYKDSMPIKDMLMSYPEVSVEGGEIKLPFTRWENRPTVSFKTVDQNNNDLAGIKFNGDYDDDFPTGTTVSDGIYTAAAPAPGLWRVSAKEETYEYTASHEMFRYNGKTDSNANRGRYEIYLWVTVDGKVELVDDAKLRELCKDQGFLDMMMFSSDNPYIEEMVMIYGAKPDYEMIKEEYRIPGDYTLEKVKINADKDEAYVLPFTNKWDLKLEGRKDETVVGVQKDVPIDYLTYECPEDGKYLVDWIFTAGNQNVSLELEGPDGTTIPIDKPMELKKGTYTLKFSKRDNSYNGYLDVFVEKKADIDPNADLHTADYIKDGGKYSNMVSFSCGRKTEHMILARYPGDLNDGYSWAFNVALPSGMDYTKGSLKVQYLKNSAAMGSYEDIKDNIPMDKLVTLDTDKDWTKASSFKDKTICSLQLDKKDGPEPGDLMVITYTGEVNTAAWYGALVDSNMSYGYWSVKDADGKISDKFNSDDLTDPAICQVFGIKLYKYSNYDRMMAQSPGEFDDDVLMQEHLLKGAEFKLEGENLSKIIAIRDDLVEMDDKPETELMPALLSDADREGKVSNGSGAGAALAKLIDEDTMMKLLYYRYEQGLQDLSKVSVAQTQTYYALNDDDMYTRVAPKSDTMQFYADNGQSYKLKPTAFSAKAGETIKAGDGGGLLLGGLGAGEYTLTEVKAPDGYAKIKPLKISIEWVKRSDKAPGYEELNKDEVPDRSGEYGLVCKIDGVVTPVLMGVDVWYPGYAVGYAPSFGSIWNPKCYVLVNPIGDDRISFVAVKEVSDPADKDKKFTLKFTIKDPQGNICEDVKYAVCQEDGQFETAKDAIPEANGWEYNLKPGEKIAFLNLEEGSTYEVTEDNDEYIASYENNKGTIAYDGDKYPTAVVTNKKGELSISKTVTGAGDTNKDFNFKVELKDGKGNELKDVTCVKGKTESKLSSGETIQLRHGESATLHVPLGTQYEVTELEANKDGYTTSAKNDEGIVSADDPVMKAAFVNDKEAKNALFPNIGNNGSPRTGDNSNLAVWLMLMMLSIIGLSLAFVRCRKKLSCKEK